MIRRRARTGLAGEREMHPTRRTLLETMVRMLDDKPAEMLTCDEVLAEAGVSRGSLYHHFQDYPDLVEHALVARFARQVDGSVEALTTALDTAASRDEFRDLLVELTRRAQLPGRASRRMERIVTFAHSANSPRLRAMLAAEQQRLTDAQAELVADAQGKGWVAPDLDPQAVAVLIQAYTLGRVVDDITPEPVDPAVWVALIGRMIDRTILTA